MSSDGFDHLDAGRDRRRWDHRGRRDYRDRWTRWRERGCSWSRRFDRYVRSRCTARERVGGATGTVAAVIPTGAPQTGFGGASLSTSPALVYVGGVALTAAGLTMVLALRRRRASLAFVTPEPPLVVPGAEHEASPPLGHYAHREIVTGTDGTAPSRGCRVLGCRTPGAPPPPGRPGPATACVPRSGPDVARPRP